jgi:A118 family predicted phage portal protein
MPKLSQRLYKGLNLEQKEELYKEYSPEFRDTSIINGLNAMLRRIEFNACLSYGDLSDVQEVEKTATEMIIAKKRKYNMVNAIEKNLKECLEDLVFALAFYNNMTTRKPELVCSFKDSILTDEDAERKQDMADMAAGIMSQVEYRMKWYNEDEATAKSKIPQKAELIE